MRRSVIAVDGILATWLGTAALVVVQLALVLTLGSAVGLGFGAGNVVGASIGLYAVATVFGMMSFAVGAATGHRGVAVAVAAATATGTFLLAGFGALVEELTDVAAVTPFGLYDGAQALSAGVDGWAVAVLLVVAVLFAAVGVVAFDRRDIAS